VTNGWDVFADALKIGLPILGTLVAVWIARSSELKKDRRRRRQDALEKIVDNFEAGHTSVGRMLEAFTTYASISREPQNAAQMKHCLEEAEHRTRAYMQAKETLFAVIGRVQMIGLPECSVALDRYLDVIEEATDVLDFTGVIPLEKSETANSLYPKLERQRKAMHEALHSAFYAV
jgi:hypothetical protein